MNWKVEKKSFCTLLLLIMFSQLRDALGKNDRKKLESNDQTIFDSKVLSQVKTLFSRSLQTTAPNDWKKSIITTAENSLHLKIDPREFGYSLLTEANENEVRKSDIYMNKAIDATALGVAVLKLIFGKDAKMVMKDFHSKDAQASLRTSEPRPKNKATLWPDKSDDSMQDRNKIQSNDKIRKLSRNILSMVKYLKPTEEKAERREAESSTVASESKEKGFSGTENNLEKMLSLMKESKNREEKGNKKSWVLLKVPSKQPQDELGMLNDQAVTEENSNDENSKHEHSHGMHTLTARETTDKMLTRQHRKKESQHKESSKRLMRRIQDQVKHLADIVRDQNNEKESFMETKHPSEKQQSYEGKSFRPSTRRAWKSLKSEPFQEMNAVKTDTTAHHRHENSVKNLLRALERSAFKHSHVRSHLRQRKIKLVPMNKKEVHASSKDEVSGASPVGSAVVSLDAIRQLGQLLGLSSQHSGEKRISPYTGTHDTLTLATAMPPDTVGAQQIPAPTPTVPPTPNIQYKVNAQNSLNRVSEQLKMFAERGLRSHNDYRRLHHAQALKWSEDLASAAEKLAYQAAKNGNTRRSELVENKGYGENVAKISNIALENAGEEATRHWYNEKQNFTFSDPVIDEETKSFTQMIWKNTQVLGMGAAKDDDTGELYVVALYSPKGNDRATLRENLISDGAQHQDVYASIFKKSLPARHE